MTPTPQPRQITASIHPDALSPAPRFVDASLPEGLLEVLQNCRRTGATQIQIATGSDGSLTTPGSASRFSRPHPASAAT